MHRYTYNGSDNDFVYRQPAFYKREISSFVCLLFFLILTYTYTILYKVEF